MIERAYYGTLPTGESVDQYTLTNNSGAFMKVITFGGIVTNLVVPDMLGRMGDVVLGFDHLEAYVQDITYQGALIGRFGNRIAGATFDLEGKTWNISQNEGPNHLHGGFRPWSKKVWQAIPKETFEGPSLILSLISPDGDEGFPGQVSVTVVYTWTHANEFKLYYTATTDQPTILNLTHHAYFHLGGDAGVEDHFLQLAARKYVALTPEGMPTGELAAVSGTPLDFSTTKRIGDVLNDDYPPIANRKGLDLNWVVDQPGNTDRPQAVLYEPHTGRRMDVYTTEPGIQVYTSNFLNINGREGVYFGKHSAICLETQHFPDSPNHAAFPSTILRPGETYRQLTGYRFASGMEAGF